MPTVKVGDINMYYEITGQGEPLVLIMGLGGDITGWMFQIPEFSKKYQVVAFDNRGAGRTDAPDKPYSIQMMASDAVGLMDSLGIDKAHILGLSMGGYIAQRLAVEHPARVKSLILAATAAAASSAYNYLLGYHAVQAWAFALAEGISPKTFVRMQLPYGATRQFFDNPERVAMSVDILAANPYWPRPHAFRRQLDACHEHDSRMQLKQMTAPTLVLVGREDILMPVKMSEEMAAGIPNAKLVVLEGGAHGFCAEIPDKFNQAVLEFLAEVA